MLPPPSLTNHFMTVADIGWYSSAYALMTASFSFSAGKLYSILPLKSLFIASLCIFEAGSLVCAAAATSWMFILGRTVAGIGFAGLVSGSYITITHCFPSQKRAVWTTVVGSSQFMGTVSAPLLGGALIDWIGWRACFGINVPLGVVAYLLIQFGLQGKPVAGGDQDLWRHKLRWFDWVGALCLVPSICCLLLALQWGGDTYRWSDARIIVLLALSLMLLGAFAWRQHRLQDGATLPPRIFHMRSVLAATWFSACINATLSITEYYGSIYFQGVKGYSATRSGLLMVPMLVGIALGNLCGGAGSAWTGYCNRKLQFCRLYSNWIQKNSTKKMALVFMIATTLLAPTASGLLTTISLDEGVAKAACLLGFLGIPNFAVSNSYTLAMPSIWQLRQSLNPMLSNVAQPCRPII